MRAALKLGAGFAKAQGDADRQGKYAAAAAALEGGLKAHYQNGFVMEEQNRQKDAAVMCAFNDG